LFQTTLAAATPFILPESQLNICGVPRKKNIRTARDMLTPPGKKEMSL
jgi:hypothetical protein